MTTDQTAPTTLFLTDNNREPISPSPKAYKAIVKAPQNLALYDDKTDLPHQVIQDVIQLVRGTYQSYQQQWGPLINKWDKADSYYWMAQKESRMPELTLSKVSSSVFYRVCRRLADGAAVAIFSEEMPVKYFPDIDVYDKSEEKQRKAIIADGLNRIALYYMKCNGMKDKTKKSLTQLYKYSNHVVHTPWEFQVGKKRSYKTHDMNELEQTLDGQQIYKHARTGVRSHEPHPPETYEVEEDVVLKDHVGFNPLNKDQFMLDQTIDDMDSQQCFFYRERSFRSDLWKQAMSGVYKNIERVNITHRFQQYGYQNQSENQNITNANKVTTDASNTEVYEHWQIWIMLPKIEVKTNKKGEVTDLIWDQNAEPRRYVMDLIGQVDGAHVVARFSESPYWSDGIPFICAHSHEDDSGWYHRGLLELLEDQMLQEQVAKGQLMDNRVLMLKRPMIRQKGRVMNKDMRITHNTVFDVVGPNALEFLTIPDFTQTLHTTLEYLKNDSESIAQVPPFMLGEALGGRTSATEFSTLRDQSSAPSMNDIKSISMQLIGGWMKKVKEYVPQFLDRDIAIEVAGDNGQQMQAILSADDFAAGIAVEEYAVGEFQSKQVAQQVLINLTQVLFNPALAPFINQVGFLERLFNSFNTVFPNPEELIRKDPQVVAMMQAFLTQQLPQQQPQPGMIPGAMNPSPQIGNAPMLDAGTNPLSQPDAAMISKILGASRGA